MFGCGKPAAPQYQPSPRHGSRSVSAMPSFTLLACGRRTAGPIAPFAGSYQVTPRSANTYKGPSARRVLAAHAGTGPGSPLSMVPLILTSQPVESAAEISGLVSTVAKA